MFLSTGLLSVTRASGPGSFRTVGEGGTLLDGSGRQVPKLELVFQGCDSPPVYMRVVMMHSHIYPQPTYLSWAEA